MRVKEGKGREKGDERERKSEWGGRVKAGERNLL